MPKRITVRVVQHRALLIEFDEKRVVSYEYDPMLQDPTEVIKGIEIMLTALDYKPDLKHMYTDMSLTVLRFTKEESANG